jgi:hypothetical protein
MKILKFIARQKAVFNYGWGWFSALMIIYISSRELQKQLYEFNISIKIWALALLSLIGVWVFAKVFMMLGALRAENDVSAEHCNWLDELNKKIDAYRKGGFDVNNIQGENMQYRKKPVIVEATQWFKNGDHPDDFKKDRTDYENDELRTWAGQEAKEKEWEGGVVRYYRRPDVSGKDACSQCGKTFHEHGWIDTLEGGHIVCPGDFIITGVKGERYPCKPDIFMVTYEPI